MSKDMLLTDIFYFCPLFGGLAQLARAFDWQSRGHRFDSDILHIENQKVTTVKFVAFFLCTSKWMFYAKLIYYIANTLGNSG